jgi:hypothetical protein
LFTDEAVLDVEHEKKTKDLEVIDLFVVVSNDPAENKSITIGEALGDRVGDEEELEKENMGNAIEAGLTNNSETVHSGQGVSLY